MTNGQTTQNLLRFSVPLFCGSILQNLYNLIDTVIVGRFVGKEALATVGNLFAPTLFVNSIIAGSASGITILISYYFGNRNQTAIQRMYRSIAKLAIILSCLLLPLCMIYIKPVLGCMKIPPNMLSGGCLYFRIIAWGFPFLIIYQYLSAIYKGFGNSKTPLSFLLLSSLSNLFLDIVFIVVFHAGIAGVALATVIAQAISAICMIAYFTSKEKFSLKPLWNTRTNDWINIYHILKFGITSTFQNSFSAISMMYVQYIVNGFGVDVISAFSAAYKIESLLTIPAVSLGSSLGVYVGQNKGYGNSKKIIEGLHSAISFSLLLFLIVNFLVWSFGDKMLRWIVGNESSVIYYGQIYLRIVAAFYFCLTMLYLLTNFLRASGEVIYPIFNTFLELVSRVLLVYWLARGFGVIGVFLGRPISFLISMLNLTIRYKNGKWKQTIS